MMKQTHQSSREISALLAVMEALRNRSSGCPWDIEQTFETIAPYTLEEAAEVADAIARGDMIDLRDELGDLLLQVVFHARMAEEQNLFDFGGVVEAITAKMIRRHPHVFGSAGKKSIEEVNLSWSEIKAQEKLERAAERAQAGLSADSKTSALDGVPPALPALARAVALQAKASKVGFDWNDARQVLAKIREECDEVEEEINRSSASAIAEEVGDLLFAVANLARHAGVDAEASLRKTNVKFERRFHYIEQALEKRGTIATNSTLQEMDALWNEAKTIEKTAPR